MDGVVKSLMSFEKGIIRSWKFEDCKYDSCNPVAGYAEWKACVKGKDFSRHPGQIAALVVAYLTLSSTDKNLLFTLI